MTERDARGNGLEGTEIDRHGAIARRPPLRPGTGWIDTYRPSHFIAIGA